MKPVLFTIPFPWFGGGLPVRAYGLMVMIGCLAGIYIALRRGKREGADPNVLWDIWMWSLIAGFAGARGYYIFYAWLYEPGVWAQFHDNPVSFFYVWEGGLAFQGGLVSAIIAVYIYMKVKGLSYAKYVDMFAAALILAYASARVGCFLNGCCHGHVTTVPWAVTYPARAPIDAAGDMRPSPAYWAQVKADPYPLPDWANDLAPCKGRVVNGKLVDTYKEYELQLILGHKAEMPQSCPVHPTQLYACASALIIFVILLIYARLPHHIGQEVSFFGVLYAVYRFIVEFFRGDSPHVVWGLTIFQLVCIGLFVAFGAAWVYCQYRMPRYVQPKDRKAGG